MRQLFSLCRAFTFAFNEFCVLSEISFWIDEVWSVEMSKMEFKVCIYNALEGRKSNIYISNLTFSKKKARPLSRLHRSDIQKLYH